MKRAALVLALAVGCRSSSPPATPPSGSAAEPAASSEPAPLAALPIPPDLQADVSRSIGIGRALYVLDKVAAIGTDVLLENVPGVLESGTVGGYLPLQEGDASGAPKGSYLISFFTREAPRRILYEVRVAPDVPPTFQAFRPAKQLPPGFEDLVQARQLAIAAMPAIEQPVNPVLMPAEIIGEQGMLVYLLAGTKQPNVAVLCKHFRAVVPLGGTSVASIQPLCNSILELPTLDAHGEPVEALVVTHVVTDFPLETHVFTSLLHHKTIFVGTRRGMWQVKGDEIAYLGELSEPEMR